MKADSSTSGARAVALLLCVAAIACSDDSPVRYGTTNNLEPGTPGAPARLPPGTIVPVDGVNPGGAGDTPGTLGSGGASAGSGGALGTLDTAGAAGLGGLGGGLGGLGGTLGAGFAGTPGLDPTIDDGNAGASAGGSAGASGGGAAGAAG